MDSRSHSAVVSEQVAQPETVASQSSPFSGQRTLSSGDMPLVWIDCEMTGLDAVNDALIEVAVIVTDSQLRPVDDGISVVIKPPAGAVERMDDFVTQMHTNSGLLVALVGVIIFMKIIPKLSRDHGVNPAWVQWLTAASPLFLYSMIASGHNDALMVGLMLWAFVAMRRGKTFAGLLLASGAIAIKPIVVLCLPFLGLTWAGKNARWGRRWMCWIVTGITVAGVLTALGGLTGTWFGWITAMAGQGMAIFPFAPFGLLGLGFGHLVSLAGGTQAGLIAQSLFYGAGKLIAIGLAGWLALARPKVSPLTSAGLVLMAASLLNPVIQPWYFYWILPFLLCRRAYFGFVEQLIVWGSTLHVIWTTATQISLPPWQELGGFQAVFTLVATAISVTALAFPRTQRELNKLPTWTDIRRPADLSIVMPTLAPWSVSQFTALRYRSPRVIDERVW